jgi:YbgC/YbaW family acyl-CoA thioester hydrolase
MALNKTRFETVLKVRPDDIDMNVHVHSSKYIDYVLAARYDQMERCYKMPIQEFMKHGFGWVIRNTFIEFKRPLGIGEEFIVETHIDEFYKDGVKVNFRILKADSRKESCTGYFNYTMIYMETGRAAIVPDWIIERYSI